MQTPVIASIHGSHQCVLNPYVPKDDPFKLLTPLHSLLHASDEKDKNKTYNSESKAARY